MVVTKNKYYISQLYRLLYAILPALRAFMWTEFLWVCHPSIPAHRAEFMELLAYDHDSFYDEGATHDRDPPRAPPLSPLIPQLPSSLQGQAPISSSTSSTSSMGSSSEGETELLRQVRPPVIARIAKKPKPLAVSLRQKKFKLTSSLSI